MAEELFRKGSTMNYIDPQEQFIRLREEELAAQREAIERMKGWDGFCLQQQKEAEAVERDRLWQLIQQASRG
jgi:heme-degrading monooxygenase HmoA